MNHQWLFNGTNLSGATNSLLTVASVSPASQGNYQAIDQLLNDGKMRLAFAGFAKLNYALDCSFSLTPANWIPQVTS